MALDENGNVRSSGWGKAFGDIASAIAGNPKADAEAENFRTTSAFNKIKLGDAERASQRDKDLDPARKGWKSLTEGSEVPDPNGEVEVLADGLGVNPKMVKKPAAFQWDADGMHFKFDQSRVDEFLKHGTALYGPDFFTKWHPFLTKAAPDYTGNLGVTGPEANLLSRNGFEGHPSAMPLSEATQNNMIERSIASNIAAGRGNAAQIKDTGMTANAEGDVIVGENHPSNAANQNEWKGPTDGLLHDENGNPFSPDDEIPVGNSDQSDELQPPEVAPDVGPVVPRTEPVYKSDLATQVSGKRPTVEPGTVPEILPDGRKVYRIKKQNPVSGPTPQEQKIDWQNTNKQSNYASAEAKVAAQKDHGTWLATLPKSIAAFMANTEGDVPGQRSFGADFAVNPYVNSIATWIAGVEQKLEVAGFNPIDARQLALEKARELYRGRYDTDWEMFGMNRAKLKGTSTLVSPDDMTQSFGSNLKQQVGDLPSKSLFADNYFKSALVRYGLDADDRKLEGLQEADARLIQKHAIHVGFLRDILRKVRTNGGKYMEESEADGTPIEKRMTEANLSQTEKSLAQHEAYLDALLRKHKIVEK
jgi:hypothetical protein